jgi:hypothetical protein
MKRLLLAGVVLSMVLAMQFVWAASDQTLYGYVSCSKCEGAKGATDGHRECMEKCIAKGADVVLVTDNDHNLVSIENPETLNGHHAHHVALQGYAKGGKFHVVSVRIL